MVSSLTSCHLLFVCPFPNVYVKEPSLLLNWKTEHFKALFLTSNRITLKSENVVYLHWDFTLCPRM